MLAADRNPVDPSSGPDASSQPLRAGFGGPAPVWAVGRARESWGMGIGDVKEQLFTACFPLLVFASWLKAACGQAPLGRKSFHLDMFLWPSLQYLSS